MTGYRLDSTINMGSLIDRRKSLSFTFNGTRYKGYEGDSLASALLAEGVMVAGRSFKYHRPRGVFAADSQETNVIVQLETGAITEPNLKATQIELYEGLVARSVNCWPSARFDLGALIGLIKAFMPAGFYYKTFMWPSWHLFESTIRRAAGLGLSPIQPDPDRYMVQHATCDLLVVGAGPAGLMAADQASALGMRVILADDKKQSGGSLLWNGQEVGGEKGQVWAKNKAQTIKKNLLSQILNRTTVVGYYDHNFLLAIEYLPNATGHSPRQKLWKIRAGHVILATGSFERPLVYAGNDLPGTMLNSAIIHYVNAYGVAPGECAVIFTTNNTGYETARVLTAMGVTVRAIIDTRAAVTCEKQAWANEQGIIIYPHTVIKTAKGGKAVRSVQIEQIGGGKCLTLECDLVGLSGGWNPAVHLFSQSGGKLEFDDRLATFIPTTSAQDVTSVGSAKGAFDLGTCLLQGRDAGLAAAASRGFVGESTEVPEFEQWDKTDQDMMWTVPETSLSSAFVDFQSDVTAADIGLAAREGFVSVEHLKRYTTLGMGVDQGKSSNINAIGIMGDLTNRTPEKVGTTKFRPPFTPVTMGAMAASRPQGELLRPRKYMPGHNWHISKGAHMLDYGWQRPSHYPIAGETMQQAALREAKNVRNAVGVLESSPLGKFEVMGADAGKFLDHIYVGTMSNLKVGSIRYGLMLNEHGTIIDDGVVAKLSDGHFLLNVSSGHADRIMDWLEEWRQCEWPDLDVVIQNVTHCWGAITLAGPNARAVLTALGCDIPLKNDQFPHMRWRMGTLSGFDVRIFRVSFSGEVSFEINIPSNHTVELLSRIEVEGKAYGLAPYGIEALDMLRIEKGYLLIGTDTDSSTIPQDIGFGRAINKKASDFIGRRSLKRETALSDDRYHLVGLMSDQMMQSGSHILDQNKKSRGFITSACFGAGVLRPIALALLRAGHDRMGEKVTLYTQGTESAATVCQAVHFDPDGEKLND
ncbi:MAG: sarcosine oxidase subunit alpha family protein [Emcibacter sp.]|nr:sarcosine oxidase subunit alpha family protein [Emcibacter sp.]